MRFVEAAYRLDLADSEWLEAIAHEASVTLGDPGMPLSVSLIRSHDRGFDREAAFFKPHDEAFLQGIEQMENLCPAELNAVKYRATHCGLGSALAQGFGIPKEMFEQAMQMTFGPWGATDVLQVQGAILDDLSVGVTCTLNEDFDVAARFRQTWERVGVHLAAGLRLRRAVKSQARLLSRADLVLERSGRVAHASEALADAPDLRALLQEAARAVDHARGELARDAPDQAIELWRGLFAGHYTVVETFDSDGRAFVVACENEPIVSETRSLTRRERQVVELAAQGHGDDFIAYTLGVGAPTVRTHLSRALAKMGIASRAELVRTAATLGLPGP